MLGLLLIAFGAVAIWAALTKRADRVFAALQMNLPQPPPASGGDGGGGGDHQASGGGDADIGSHQAMDASGHVYTINKSYANMSDAERGDANRFAHHNDNAGSF